MADTLRPEPYHDSLQVPAVYQNTLSALSKISPMKGMSRETIAYRHAPKSVHNLVTILNMAALLMVYDEGDTAATGLLREGNVITLLCAKNLPSQPSDEEKAYLANIGESFKRLDAVPNIIEVVIPMCRKMIALRVRKFVELFQRGSGTTQFGAIAGDDPCAEPLRQDLIRVGIMLKKQSLQDYLDHFLNAIRRLNDRSDHGLPDDGLMANILWHALWLTDGDHTIEYLQGITSQSFRKVMKIGAYWNACVTIKCTFRHLPTRWRKNFNIRMVTNGPPQQFFTPQGLTLDALNEWTSRRHGSRITDLDRVKFLYPAADPGAQGLEADGGALKVNACQHAELTLGILLSQDKRDRKIAGPVTLGMSKASCFYCALWLRTFNEWCARDQTSNRGREIFSRSYSDRKAEGWILPPAAPEIHAEVLDGIGGAVDEIVYNLGSPRRYAALEVFEEMLQDPFKGTCI